MRMVSSCNGCRALRKGCSDDCTIRPCLQWIKNKNPEAQGNATVFLAKFYGRAGLLNLIAAAPDDTGGQAVFRSLLYEACGRIVNPVYGAVGLLWSGQWQKCVDAVQAVFNGELGMPVDVVQDVDAASSEAAAAPPPPLRARPGASSSAAYDIRHFAKNSDAAAAADLLRFARAGRTGLKRGKGSPSYASKAKLLKGKGKATKNVRASPSPPLGQGQQQEAEELEPVPMVMELLEHGGGRNEEFAGSHDHHLKLKGSKENTDVEAAASHVIQAEAEPPVGNQVLVADQEEEKVGLELTLGFEPVPVVRQQPCGDQTGSSGLRLQLPPA
jgi:hypothetical protein